MGNDRIQFVQKSDTATGALALVISGVNQIANIAVTIDALPTTSEALTVTLNAAAGTNHLVYTVDPSVSTGSAWNLFLDYEPTLGLAEGDTITIAYANTDTNTVDVVANCIPF